MKPVISASEALHRQASDAETVVWVDEHDQLLGQLPRAQLREQGLIGRGSFIFLFNPQGALCVHQRTFSKALYPGFWDIAAGGMVAAGESYAQSAARELAEELGVCDAPLTLHGTRFFAGQGNRLWCGIFSAVSAAPIRAQPEEVLSSAFIELKDFAAWRSGRQICPDSLSAMALVPQLRDYC